MQVKDLVKDAVDVFKMVLIIVLQLAIMFMPMMRGYYDSGSIYFYAAGLFDFTILGYFIWLTPIIFMIIWIGKVDIDTKKKLFIAMGVANFASYVVCIMEAKEWLASIGGTYIAYYNGFVLYPAAIIISVVLLCYEIGKELHDLEEEDENNYMD